MSGASEIVLVDNPALFLRLLPSLAALLHACVSTGASINFVQPFTLHGAEAFWTRQLDDIVHSGHQRLYAALDDDGGGLLRVLGCVILKLAHQPNQQHRCDLSKMLVHPDARRQCVALPLAVAMVQPGSLTLPFMLRSLRGLGARLLDTVEAEAKRQGRWLLCLDTETDSAGEKLYLRQ